MGKQAKRVKAGSADAARLEKRIAFVQEYIKLWRQYFQMFSEGFEGRKILKRDEEEFARIVNSLAHHHYRFSAVVYPELKDADAVIKLLWDTISLSHLKGLSDAQLSKILQDWHSVFIDMNKALGRLMARRPLLPEDQLAAQQRKGQPQEEAPQQAPEVQAPASRG